MISLSVINGKVQTYIDSYLCYIFILTSITAEYCKKSTTDLCLTDNILYNNWLAQFLLNLIQCLFESEIGKMN